MIIYEGTNHVDESQISCRELRDKREYVLNECAVFIIEKDTQSRRNLERYIARISGFKNIMNYAILFL